MPGPRAVARVVSAGFLRTGAIGWRWTMRAWRLWICGVGVLAATAGTMGVSSQSRPGASGPVLYEGARLILGDERPVIDNGAFVVADGRLTALGRKGEVP